MRDDQDGPELPVADEKVNHFWGLRLKITLFKIDSKQESFLTCTLKLRLEAELGGSTVTF